MNLLQKIREAIARLAELTEDELTALKADVVKCADEFSGADTNENIKVLSELGGIADAIKTRSAELKTQKEELTKSAEEARKRIASLDDTAPIGSDAPDGDDPEADPEADPDADPEADPEADPATSKEPIAASGAKRQYRSNPNRMARRAGATRISPELDGAKGAKISLTAANNQLGSKRYGDVFTDKYDLGEAMAEKLSDLDKNSVTGKVLIASARWRDAYPESRRLNDRWTIEDLRKLDAVVSPASLAASGGVCLPTNVDYSLDTWSTADRPLRDGLPGFAVDRGGLLYRQPPTIGDLDGATAVWTNANDITPTDPTTKPVLAIECADTVQVFISAIPTRLQFGNLMGQFDPETIAANTDQAIANAARQAELAELTTIQGFATSVTSAQVLGASRDFITTIIQTAAAFRFTNRLNRGQVLTLIAPIWAMDLLKMDRVRELAHDDSGTAVFSISDDEINEWLMAYGVKAIWTLDGLAANAGGGTYVAQTFSAFTGGDAIPAWPTEVMWNLFIEGSIQFLDGGRLDLGVVRDATLDATNDYETFVEPFENVANRGFAGGVLQVTSTLKPTGASSATVTVS